MKEPLISNTEIIDLIGVSSRQNWTTIQLIRETAKLISVRKDKEIKILTQQALALSQDNRQLKLKENQILLKLQILDIAKDVIIHEGRGTTNFGQELLKRAKEIYKDVKGFLEYETNN